MHLRHCSLFPIFILILLSTGVQGGENQIKTLYFSLEQNSIPQLLSFYELYPDTLYGEKALLQAFELLSGGKLPKGAPIDLTLTRKSIEAMINLVNKRQDQELPSLSETELQTIEKIGERLANRKLKGYYAGTEKEMLELNPDEIDVARGVILSQVESEELSMQTVRSYEAMIDLMALQIAVKLKKDATPYDKIRAMNTFVFEEMGFRFPPHSKYAKDIDLYTFLPSVLDSRHGVCLGVSILYLSLAQRLDLKLEVITPPGHIYVRYRNGHEVINIETTARGVHVDSEEYLGIRSKKLQERNMKEVIGLAHINNASACFKEENFKEALSRYQKAKPYLPDDKLTLELMGFCYLFTGEKEKGELCLKEAEQRREDHLISKSTLTEDYFSEKAGIQAIREIFLPVDETRESILKKKDAIELVLRSYPAFREGWQSLGAAWLQLHRVKEALICFQATERLDPTDCTVQYYLSILYASRHHYPKAWDHLKKAEELAKTSGRNPKALKALRLQLAMSSPE